MKYNIFFILIHNLLIRISVINADMYTLEDEIYWIVSSLCFQTNETMMGASWFFPFYVVAVILFGIAIYQLKGYKHKYLLHGVTCVMVGGLGCYLCMKDYNVIFHIQISLLAIPFIYIGYGLSRKWDKAKKIFNLVGGLISAIIIIMILQFNEWNGIELSINRIINPTIFYPLSFVGIFFCISLAVTIEKLGMLGDIVAKIGENSIHIMMLHFFMFKIIDVIYGIIKFGFGYKREIISSFPVSFRFGIVYSIAGVILPLLIVSIEKKIREYIGVCIKEKCLCNKM